jgi:hypothetical protein
MQRQLVEMLDKGTLSHSQEISEESLEIIITIKLAEEYNDFMQLMTLIAT